MLWKLAALAGVLWFVSREEPNAPGTPPAPIAPGTPPEEPDNIRRRKTPPKVVKLMPDDHERVAELVCEKLEERERRGDKIGPRGGGIPPEEELAEELHVDELADELEELEDASE